ncbi:hypothetical protein [uncultured Jannaschia sp.]|uniref:hypothetical protein n=1 Tax=uncultured Jannaschia sp. TaxID=293347 RepID=UPI00263A0826|nr:hypothetical protein [uncultured Jannaschia sp.]
MKTISSSVLCAAIYGFTSPASSQCLPTETRGSWDVSASECRSPGKSVTRIDIGADTITTFGGNARVREV